MSSDSSRRSTVLVGLFISIGLGLFIVGLFSVGTLRDLTTPKISVSSDFTEVGGLTRGAAVWYSGVEVGTVQEVTLTPGGTVRVDMGLIADHLDAIPGDVDAQIGSDGLIGNTIVTLGHGTSGDRLEDGDLLESVTSVGATQLMEDVQKTNDNLLAITNDLREMTNTMRSGEGSIARLLEDESLYPSLVSTLDNLDAASNDARRTAGSTARFAADLNDPNGLPQQIVNDTTTWAEVTGAVDTLSGAAESVGDAADGLAKGETPIGVLLSDDGAGTDLKQTFDTLQRSSVLLEEDLEAVQHNFLLRRYFKKKAKKEAKAAEQDASAITP